MERDPAAVDDLRNPLVEVLADERFLVRTVDEEQLDRLVEVVGRRLRQRRDRRDEIGDAVWGMIV